MKTNFLALMAFSTVLFGGADESAEKVIDAGRYLSFQNQNSFSIK